MTRAATDGYRPPELTAVQQRVLDAFRTDGIAVARFQELFGEGLWNAARADIEPFVEEIKARRFGELPAGKEEVIVRRFYKRDGDGAMRFSLSDPWLRIAASDTMLGIVNGYCGQPTWLYYLDNWFTVPYPQADTRVASQRWHRDPEDALIVKVFVYFSDVDEEAGPFEYIRSSAAGGRYGDLFAWGEGHRYPPPEELEGSIEPEDRLTMTGPAGTVIFCDTAGFHRGGFARTRPRILSISTFLRPGVKKGASRFEVDLEGREDDLSPQVRAALGLTA